MFQDLSSVFATVITNGVKARTCPTATMKSDMGPEYLVCPRSRSKHWSSVAPCLHAAALAGRAVQQISVVGEKHKLGLERTVPVCNA